MRTITLCFFLALMSTVAIAQKAPERCPDTTSNKAVIVEELINVAPEGTLSKKTEFLKDVTPPKSGTTLMITEKDVQVFIACDTGIVTSNKTAKWQRSNGSSSDDYRETNTYVH